MRCPVCGSENIAWNGDYGFVVPGIAVAKIEGGWLWRGPPVVSPVIVGRREDPVSVQESGPVLMVGSKELGMVLAGGSWRVFVVHWMGCCLGPLKYK